MNVIDHADAAVARIAAAIGEPARARMLYCLMDGHARTSTELAVVAGVAPSTASVHLKRLRAARLVKWIAQGKHRFYGLDGREVASTLERLSVLAGVSCPNFVPTTPNRLRAARTCYDHLAGAVGVALHDRLFSLGWLCPLSHQDRKLYDLTLKGRQALADLQINLERLRASRRRFACACLDWSERRPHLGGALGAALLHLALARKWMVQEPDSRALQITPHGKREMRARLGIVCS